MFSRDQFNTFVDHPLVEWSIFVVGVILMLLSPLAGIIPGPGGIFVFAIGLAMVLKTSMWAKRRYVRFKRWQPKAGRVADWGLRRGSAKRRETIRKDRVGPGLAPQGDGGLDGDGDPGPNALDSLLPARGENASDMGAAPKSAD